MKFYHSSMIITLLLFNHQVNAFWNKWIDTISTKISNNTEVIMHREFPKAQYLELNNEQGSIVINSWKQSTIAVEVVTTCPESSLKNIKIDMEYIDQDIKIHTIFTDPKIKGSVLFNILVPKDTNLIISTKQGDIIIKDVDGSLDVETMHGDIKILNPHHEVQAKNMHGSIVIRTDKITADKEFNLEVDKGDIELYTTQTINTYLNAHALNGKVTCDLAVKLDSKTTKLDAAAWKQFRQIVHGSIGTPISKVHMNAHNGSITILPYTKQNDIF